MLSAAALDLLDLTASLAAEAGCACSRADCLAYLVEASRKERAYHDLIASLVSDSVGRGGAVLAEITRQAVERLLSGGPQGAYRLFTPEERAALEAALAETIGRADLIARWILKDQAGRARARAERRGQESRPSPWDALLEAAPPGPTADPEEALAYLAGLMPVLGTDPQRQPPDYRRKAFTLAVATETELVAKVQGAITDLVRSGEVQTGTAAVQAVLDAAGVAGPDSGYAETVFRTNAMDAYNQGLQDQLAQEIETFPVWRYSNPSDNRSRPKHRALNGKYFPSTTPFTQVRGTGIEDVARCRCVLPGAWVQGRVLAVSKASYSGEAVELVTKSGARLSVTPNHPVLTTEGFVAAGALQQGQHLVSYRRHVERLVVVDDEQDAPALIEDVFGAVEQLDGVRVREAWSALHFHGDGAAVEGEVEVVLVDRVLLGDPDPDGTQRGREGVLGGGDVEQPGLSGGRPGEVGLGHGGRLDGAPQPDAGLLQSLRDDVPGHAEGIGKALEGLPALVAADEGGNVEPVDEVVVRPDGDAGRPQLPGKGLLFEPRLAGELFDALAGEVASTDHVEVGEVLGSVKSGNLVLAPDRDEAGQSLAESRRDDPRLGRQLGQRGPGLVAPGKVVQAADARAVAKPRRIGPASELDVRLTEPSGDEVMGGAQLARELAERFPGLVAADEVVEVRRFHYRGPVYDLQTETGYYTTSHDQSASLFVHNCTAVPIDRWDWEELQSKGARVEDGYALPVPPPPGPPAVRPPAVAPPPAPAPVPAAPPPVPTAAPPAPATVPAPAGPPPLVAAGQAADVVKAFDTASLYVENRDGVLQSNILYGELEAALPGLTPREFNGLMLVLADSGAVRAYVTNEVRELIDDPDWGPVLAGKDGRAYGFYSVENPAALERVLGEIARGERVVPEAPSYRQHVNGEEAPKVQPPRPAGPPVVPPPPAI